MEPVPVPIAEDVRDLLADLTNRVVIVDSDRTLDPTTLPIVARYVSDDGELIALSCWSLAAAAGAAGAFAMIPRHTVDESIAAGSMDELVAECFHEVANIASRWLHSATSPHLRLDVVHEGWRDDEHALVEQGRSRGYVVSIDGYADGRAACVAINPPA